jgi:hypothetical protein
VVGSPNEPSRLPRRPLIIGALVVAGLVLVGALAATLSGGGSSAPFSSGTPAGQGFACQGLLYLSWTTSNGQIHGIAEAPIAGGKRTITGTQTGSTVHLTVDGSTQTAQLTSTGLVLHETGNASITCPLTTHQHFLAMSSQAAAPLASRAAESNLTNAITAAKASFVAQQSYPAPADSASSLSSTEPSLNFTTGPTSSPDKISVAVASDGQAIILATRSGTGRCVYAADNEQSTPETHLAGPPIPPGTFFNASPQGRMLAACSASDPTPLVGTWIMHYPT